jgi:DNA-binding sugar fermentation-stimulating protein
VAEGEPLSCFVVLRDDAHAVAPNRAADPRFAAALDRARDAGVRTIAYRCSVTLESMGRELEITVI